MRFKTQKTLILAAMLALAVTQAQAAVRVGNCDKVTHVVDAEIAGEKQKITLKPGEHYQIFGWPVRLKLEGKTPTGYITDRQARQLDEYCIWDGVLHFQRRRTALWH